MRTAKEGAMMGGEHVGSRAGVKIDIPSLPNLRDIGGYAVAGGGRVKMGQLYRSVDLSRLHGDDVAALAGLGIRTVFDLRTQEERSAQPDVLPPGAKAIVCDVLAGDKQAAPAQLFDSLVDPAATEKLLGGGKAAELFEEGYRLIVGLPSALAAYRAFFEAIAQDARRPALFHCTTGKDRTGWAAAMTLLLLGVSEDDVFHDYMLTNRDLLPALKPLYDKFEAAGGDPHLLDPVMGVERVYLQTALDALRAQYGSVEGYFTDGLGIDAAGQDALRRALIEPGAPAGGRRRRS
jgi:protein-tyrosine phosphatase